jgi:rhamnose transport system substrate-binding protein
MGTLALDGHGEAAMAPPFTYNKENVDQFSKIF